MSEEPKHEAGIEGKDPKTQALEQAEVPEILDLLRSYGRPALLFLLLGLAVVAGLSAVRHRRRAAALDAARRFAQAETVEELGAVADAFPTTPTGPLALLAQGSQLFRDGQVAEAAERLDLFLLRYPEHAMVPGVRLLRAGCDEAREAWEQAETAYAALLTDEGAAYLHASARLGKGRVLEATGRLDEARALYEDFLAAHPDDAWAPDVEAALRALDRRRRAPPAG